MNKTSRKIKLYIVTYNNSIDLNANLQSLFDADFKNHNIEVNIINNHSNLLINDEFTTRVNVLNNVLRPDFSTGHLARNWNQAIINGFKNLNNPDCDILITCQDDTIFDKDWLTFLLELHENHNFVQMGIGDNFCSYLPEAVKLVGLWDEALFTSIAYQEADYFLRQLIYNREKTCLNDFQHGRLINPVNFTTCTRPQPPHIFSEEHKRSMQFHALMEKHFYLKWPNVPPNYWTADLLASPPIAPAIKRFMLYPYFEKDIYDLSGKNYII